MNNKSTIETWSKKPQGQSLVETALFLPILIVMLLGIVEVSSLLITQNRIATAARISAGYGATNYNQNDWTSTANNMGIVALNAVTTTMDLSPDLWDIWSIYGRINSAGTGFAAFSAEHVYGDHAALAEEDWDEDAIKSSLLAELQSTSASVQDLEFVASVNYHNSDTFLNLPIWQWVGYKTLSSMTVMRIDTTPPFAGCQMFPIGLHHQNLSLYPQNYSGTMAPGGERYTPNGWDYPTNPGAYNDNPYDHSGFPRAVGGRSLANANRGDIFVSREVGAGPGAFGWLSWTGDTQVPALRPSVEYPGNLSLIKPPPLGKVNYRNPDNPPDHIPAAGKWVHGSNGNMNDTNVRQSVQSIILNQRVVQIIVFDDSRGTGVNVDYHIAGFMVVKLHAYTNTGSPSNRGILVEFIDWGEGCYDLDE